MIIFSNCAIPLLNGTDLAFHKLAPKDMNINTLQGRKIFELTKGNWKSFKRQQGNVVFKKFREEEEEEEEEEEQQQQQQEQQLIDT